MQSMVSISTLSVWFQSKDLVSEETPHLIKITFNFYLLGQHGNYPNEEYFCRRIETSPEISSGLQLRQEEDEVIARERETFPLRNGEMKRKRDEQLKLNSLQVSIFTISTRFVGEKPCPPPPPPPVPQGLSSVS